MDGIVGKVISFIVSVFFAAQTIVTPLSNESVLFMQTYPHVAVENLWISYSKKIQKDGRTIDRSRNYLTTSEGQSYSMLRAVWMDDKDVFDRVLNWTNNNLRKRDEDKLFAWKWGQNSDGRWDVIVEDGGMNTASDADQDIALALIFAYKRWNNEAYLNQAKEVLNFIWEKEVLVINGKPYMLAGNWAKTEDYPTINPSYFSFAAYPIFAEVDPSHPWLDLRSNSYELLRQATTYPLDEEKSANIPPDWFNIDPITGEIVAPVHDDKTSNFSDDAIRIPWRVGLDYDWHQNQEAKEYLEMLEFFKKEWQEKHRLSREYSHAGEVVSEEESDSLYGALLPYFHVVHPDLAKEVYYDKIVPLYNPDTEEFGEDLGYYAQNWVWFGMAYYEGKLPNLYD